MASKNKSEEARSLLAAFLNEHPDAGPAEVQVFAAEHPGKEQDLAVLFAKIEQLRALVDFPPGVIAAHLGDNDSSTDEGEIEPGWSNPVDASPAMDVMLVEDLPRQTDNSRRYRSEGEVARGGMGSIQKVWDRDLRRFLAMKVSLVTTPVAGEDAVQRPGSSVLARFLEEAQITGQLDHPGIVPVHEVGLDSGGHLYFTMRLIRGRDLRQIFDLARREEDGWSRTRALGALLKVCETMAFAHAKGVIHRDLKPANVMVGRFGEVYVMDWGLAKVLGQEDRHDIRLRSPETASVVQTNRQAGEGEQDSPLITMDGTVIGTPTYMPPEQARGEVEGLSPRSDVYSIGAMIYHLLVGQAPYVQANVRLTPHTVLAMVILGSPRPIREFTQDVPPELEAICEKAMARDPAERYADTNELANDLRAYLEGRVVHAFEGGAWAEARKWVRRNKSLAMALASVVVLAICGLGTIVYANRQLKKSVGQRDEAIDSLKDLTGELKAANEDLSEQTRVAEARTEEVLRLSALLDHEALIVEVDRLWPAYPENIQKYKAWVDRAKKLAADLPIHVQKLAELRSNALPQSEEERRAEKESRPEWHRLQKIPAEMDELGAKLLAASSEDEVAKLEQDLARLEEEQDELESRVSERRDWQFPEERGAAHRWNTLLTKLIEELEGLIDPKTGLLSDAEDALSPKHGMSVPRRIAFAELLRDRFAAGGEFDNRWRTALPDIREAYPGLALAPQMGLVPIGPDPDSGLWEFWHVASGTEPHRDRDSGHLRMEESSGVVLVLLPGGKFLMGAQTNPSMPNFDPQANWNEAPVREVSLSAFFLSKYEMTQGQWVRMRGSNPSFHQPTGDDVPTLLHPVEVVSWIDCMTWLPRIGLSLPSEAQWEYGARGGTQTPWWAGQERESLRERHAANLADQALGRQDPRWPNIKDWPELDDGYAAQAPVGTYSANPFGLHEVAGNLWEWCLDGEDSDFSIQSPDVDPLSPWARAVSRYYRGGAYYDMAALARSANRNGGKPSFVDEALGLRPARALEP